MKLLKSIFFTEHLCSGCRPRDDCGTVREKLRTERGPGSERHENRKLRGFMTRAHARPQPENIKTIEIVSFEQLNHLLNTNQMCVWGGVIDGEQKTWASLFV